jgi:hypothetical protein
MMYVINFPVIYFVLIGLLVVRLFLSGLFNGTFLFIALLCYFIFSCMDELRLFNPIKSYIEVIQADQLKLLNHKKTKFLFFYVLEQQYTVLLLFIFLVPCILEEMEFFFILNLEEQDFLFHLKFYMFSFIVAVALINLVIVVFFNPGPVLKTIAACIGCVGGVAIIGAAYFSYTDSVWDRATGGIREPGPSDAVAEAQLVAFKARITTAEGIKQANMYREFFFRLFTCLSWN